MRFLLVRHAHVDAALPPGPDTPFSPRGEAQADWLAPALAGERAARLLTPRPCAPWTPQRGSPARSPLTPEVDAALAEFRVGRGRSYAEAQAARPDLAVWHPDQRGREDGESLSDFQARVTALLTSLRSGPPATMRWCSSPTRASSTRHCGGPGA